MDKLIVVLYFNIEGSVGNTEILERCKAILEDGLPEDSISFILPVRGNQPTKLEVINKPVMVVGEDYKKEIEEQYKKLEKSLEEEIDGIED